MFLGVLLVMRAGSPSLSSGPAADAFGAVTPLVTWTALEQRLPSSVRPEAVYDAPRVDSAQLEGRTVLFRDRQALCPYAQRVWLALELKKADYVTVLVDDEMYRATPAGLYLPRVQWADGTSNDGAGEIKAILERIDKEHPHAPSFFPRVSVSVDFVRDSFNRFDGIMPRFCRKSSLAPFVFPDRIQRAGKWELEDAELGELVPRYKYEVTLEEVEEILGEYSGAFIAGGTEPTAADVVWAPFLERLSAHLPLLYPDGGYGGRLERFEAIREWHDAMDTLVPCYSCRVRGRAVTWERALREAHPELELPPEQNLPPDLPAEPSFDASAVWQAYAEGVPHLADTPAEEMCARIVRHRRGLTAAAAEACALPAGGADAALREVCATALSDERAALSAEAQRVAVWLDAGGLTVPRDLGVVPAEALRALARGDQ